MHVFTIITILQYLLSIKGTYLTIAVISITGRIFAHYIYYTPLNVWKSFSRMDKKKALILYLCAWFGLLGVFGGGLPIVYGLLLSLRLKGRSNYGGGSKGGSGKSILLCESTNQNKTQTNVVKKRPRDEMSKENICAGSGGSHPPCKRGRKSKIDCEHRCGDCTDLLKYHKQDGNMCHPFKKVIYFFNLFLSCNGAHKISLRADSCLCNACYRDCTRGTGKPRWLGLMKHLSYRHCILCCKGPSCTCNAILEWGPEHWYGSLDELKTWLAYYQCSTSVDDQKNITCVNLTMFQCVK